MCVCVLVPVRCVCGVWAHAFCCSLKSLGRGALFRVCIVSVIRFGSTGYVGLSVGRRETGGSMLFHPQQRKSRTRSYSVSCFGKGGRGVRGETPRLQRNTPKPSRSVLKNWEEGEHGGACRFAGFTSPYSLFISEPDLCAPLDPVWECSCGVCGLWFLCRLT